LYVSRRLIETELPCLKVNQEVPLNLTFVMSLGINACAYSVIAQTLPLKIIGNKFEI